jgi:hypothetical protein
MDNINISKLESLHMHNSPLLIYEPFNAIVFLSFYSPIIIAICMVGLSFAYQNAKGFVFFGFLLGCSIIRSFVYSTSESKPIVDDNTICTSVQYTKYGNPSVSAFVFAFTITYLGMPMLLNNNVNFWVLIGLIIYFGLDLSIKLFKNCVIKMTDLFLNILAGGAAAAAIVGAMYAGGSKQFLFYNSSSSDNSQCSMPSKQTFKCSVYKNGELVAGTTTSS